MKLIESVKEITDITISVCKSVSDTIYCYDIEVTSLFKIDNRYVTFDKTKNRNFYKKIDKVALPYVSQFSIENEVYYFRDFFMFGDILKKISDKRIRKIVYVHNLSYEFQFLLNIFKREKYTIEHALVRSKKHVISFILKELNIEFRCSFMLTNLSLEKCAKEYSLKTSKKVGNLDYLKAHSPVSILNSDELEYIECDLKVMYEFLCIFRKEFKCLNKIPYTQTGEMRRHFLDKYISFHDIKKIKTYIPQYSEYLYLMSAFWGGITHANYIHANKILYDVASFDYSSDYPFQLAVREYPCQNFYEIKESEIDRMKDKCCLIYDVTLFNVQPILYNRYIPLNKCYEISKFHTDNGRIMSANKLSIIVTDIDLKNIELTYSFDIKINKVYCAYKKRLSTNFVRGILDLYSDKTKLKNIDNLYFSYMKSKQKLNSSFGAACTNILKQKYFIDLLGDDVWQSHCKSNELSKEFILSKIDDLYSSRIFINYSTGVWVTAYARESLWTDLISKIDKDSVYYDTDSDKILNYEKHSNVINSVKEKNFNLIKEASVWHNIPIERFCPKDSNGKTHILGDLEFETVYDELKTLGAKKYATKSGNDISITIAGVPKENSRHESNARYLNGSLDNFRNGLIFDYGCGKLALKYLDNIEPFEYIDCDGNLYVCDNIKYGICIYPTTYTLSNSVDDEDNIDNILDNILCGYYDYLV